jgi:hypothetical protein
MSLAIAARIASGGRRATQSVTVEQGAERFMLHVVRSSLRPRSKEWYESHLTAIRQAMAEDRMDRVTRAQINAYLATVPGAPGTRAGRARAIRALWRWGSRQEPPLCDAQAVEGLATTGPDNGGEAGILTVGEVERILANAGPYRSALGLLLFAGVRPEEIHGRSKAPMLWSAVNMAERMIRVEQSIAKTGRARIIENLPPTVWFWLQPGQPNEPISPGRTRQALDRAQAVLGRAWPHDATRHSFASYAYARDQDEARLKAQMGHSQDSATLWRHYRRRVSRKEAERFWGIGAAKPGA